MHSHIGTSFQLIKTHSRCVPFIFYFLEWVGFLNLVDTLEHREEFKKQYKIPSEVTTKHCKLGEWHKKRPTRVVAIPMIAFIEGRMRILMGKVTRDFF